METKEAREKLRRAESDLRMTEIVSEEHEKAIKEIKEAIEKLEEFINKPERWQDKLAKGDYVLILGPCGLSSFAYDLKGAKAEVTFKTKEHAQLLADKMNLMQEMHAFAHVKNEGWEPDCKDEYQGKWGIAIYGDKCVIDIYYNLNVFIFGIAVKSKEIANEMLEEFGERVAKIYNKQY